MPHKAAVAVVLTLAVGQFACETPAEVSRFCASAATVIRSGDPLIDDLKASCLRETQTHQEIGKFSVKDAASPACEDIGKQADGLRAASKVLANYFTALNNLASFGSGKTGEDSKSFLGDLSKVKLSAGMQKSIGSIAGFLTTAITAGYRQRHLADDIVNVRGDVQAVIAGLRATVDVYLQELQFEEASTAARYQEFLAEHPGNGDAIVLLDARWQNDRAMFDARRHAAKSYQEALDAAAKGNEELAAHARDLKAKDLFALLNSSSSQLDNLGAVIRKAFL